jgi:hypothetical protein
MAYKSEAQRKKFHALLAEGKIKKEVVDEYDAKSKGKKLPERVTKPKIRSIEQIKEIARKKGY